MVEERERFAAPRPLCRAEGIYDLGRTIVKRVQEPGVDSHEMLPPYDVTIAFTRASPRPLPGSERLASARQNRLKMCGMSAAAMPRPVFDTVIVSGVS